MVVISLESAYYSTIESVNLERRKDYMKHNLLLIFSIQPESAREGVFLCLLFGSGTGLTTSSECSKCIDKPQEHTQGNWVHFAKGEKRSGEARRGETITHHHCTTKHTIGKTNDHLLQTPCCWWLACTHPPMIVSNYTITSPILIMPPTFLPVLNKPPNSDTLRKKESVSILLHHLGVPGTGLMWRLIPKSSKHPDSKFFFFLY